MKKTVTLLVIMVILPACSPSLPLTPSATINFIEQPSAIPLPSLIVTSTIALTEPVEPAKTPSMKAALPTEPAKTLALTPTAPSQTKGLGLTRADAAQMFQFLEFNFELKKDAQSQEAYIGTISDELATVTVIGQEENISSMSITINVPKPPTENQSSRIMAYLAALLSVAADDWEEGSDWLNESLNNIGESRTAIDNRNVVLIITPEDDKTIVKFTIFSK